MDLLAESGRETRGDDTSGDRIGKIDSRSSDRYSSTLGGRGGTPYCHDLESRMLIGMAGERHWVGLDALE
jgi:hypothetical protein